MKFSPWPLRKPAFLNVFITDKHFRMSHPYFLSLDFVSLNCRHFPMCGSLTPWISWGEFLICGAFLSAALGAVLRGSKLVVRLQITFFR